MPNSRPLLWQKYLCVSRQKNSNKNVPDPSAGRPLWSCGDGPTSASFPGPTIEATSGQTVTVNSIDDLCDTSRGDELLALTTAEMS